MSLLTVKLTLIVIKMFLVLSDYSKVSFCLWYNLSCKLAGNIMYIDQHYVKLEIVTKGNI